MKCQKICRDVTKGVPSCTVSFLELGALLETELMYIKRRCAQLLSMLPRVACWLIQSIHMKVDHRPYLCTI